MNDGLAPGGNLLFSPPCTGNRYFMRVRFLLLGILLSQPLAMGELVVTNLTCEHQINPMGLHAEVPRLSWQFQTSEKAKYQQAYRVIASSSREALARDEGDLWDTGKKTSRSSYLVFYKGEKALRSGQRVFWKVRAWDEKDVATPWSDPAHFAMGLLGADDWKAEWISFRDESPLHRNPTKLHLPPPRYYRRDFGAAKKIVRARLHASALGVLELQLNGSKVGDAFLAPGWSDYSRQVYYQSHDVTSLVKQGENCLGAIVGDGWYAGYLGSGKREKAGPYGTGRNIYGKTPALLAQLHLEFDDGTESIISSDPTWKVAPGPEFEADLLMGEGYDATRELGDWSQAGYDAKGWEQAVEASSNKPAKAPFQDRRSRRAVEVGFIKPRFLKGYAAPPIRVIEERKPVSTSESRPKCHLFDFGQNFTGKVRLQVDGMKKGQRLVIRYGVTAGDLSANPQRNATATDTYVCRGGGPEAWSPRFTLHTFRYAEVEGLPGKPGPDTLRGLVMHSDTPLTSGFECSDERINRIYRNCVWTQRANWIDLPSNSEQVNERMGDLAAVQLFTKAACYHTDNAAFLRKWLGELQGARDKQGLYRRHAPFPFALERVSYGAGFSDAGIHAVFDHWWMYGDEEVLKENWVAMKKYLQARHDAYRTGRGRVFGMSGGDPLHFKDPTPSRLIDVAMLALDFRLMAEMARVAGNPLDRALFNKSFLELKEAFQKSFVNEDGSLKVQSQTSHVLALRFGLLTEKSKARVLADLLAKLKEKASPTSSGMTVGALGAKSLLPVLTWTGNHDTALRLLTTGKYPSWAHGVDSGATTLRRSWGPVVESQKLPDAEVDLRFGAVGGWLMSKVAGIDTVFPGFERIRLEPWVPEAKANAPGSSLTWVKAHYHSRRGRIDVHWKQREGAGLLYECTIPVQTTAAVRLPSGPETTFLIDGVAPDKDNQFKGGFLHRPEEGRVTINLVQSGSYRIEVK